LVGGVRAEDEQEGEHGGDEREGSGGNLECGHPGGEALVLDAEVDEGDEDGGDSGQEDWGQDAGDHAGGGDADQVAAVAVGGLVALPLGVAVDRVLIRVHLSVQTSFAP